MAITSDSFTVSNLQVSNGITNTNSTGQTIATGTFSSIGNGCNESKRFDNVEKAAYHGLKFPYRVLGLHNDTGTFDIVPEAAVAVAAEVARTYLDAVEADYDREESHEYLVENDLVSDGGSLTDKVLGGDDSDLADADVEDLQRGMEKMWTQMDKKKNHADACRTALAISEAYLGEEL